MLPNKGLHRCRDRIREFALRSCWWLVNPSAAAALLDVSPRTLRLAIDRGDISAVHPFADGPWIISRRVLEGESAQALKHRVSRGTRRPAVLDSQQCESLFSTT
jgi:hypothetical protein